MYPTTDTSVDVNSLFARARAGDNTAWEELFQTCYPKVIRVVRRKLNRPMRSLYDSTDFASDVMKSLAAKADRLDFDSFAALVAFLMDEAEKKVIDEYRRVHAQKRDIDRHCHLGAVEVDGDGGAAVGLALASGDPTASEVAQAGEAHERLLAGQDDEKRTLIELKHQGYTNLEIAGRLGWNIRKVQRFLKDLKASLGFSGGDDGA